MRMPDGGMTTPDGRRICCARRPPMCADCPLHYQELTPDEIADKAVEGWNAPAGWVKQAREIVRLNAALGLTEFCRSCGRQFDPAVGCRTGACTRDGGAACQP